MKKITFQKHLETMTCTVYADDEVLEVIPMGVGCTARLKELGYDFAAATRRLPQTSSGRYGWGVTRSAGINRKVV